MPEPHDGCSVAIRKYMQHDTNDTSLKVTTSTERSKALRKMLGVITSVDVKCLLLFFLVRVFSKFSTMNMYPLILFY